MSKRKQMIGVGSCMALFILIGIYWHPFTGSECEEATVNKICAIIDTQSVDRPTVLYMRANGSFPSYFEVDRIGKNVYEISNRSTVIIRLEDWFSSTAEGELNGAKLSWRQTIQLWRTAERFRARQDDAILCNLKDAL